MYSNYGVTGRVHFTVGGAQAVDDALKLAFNYTHKQGVICFEGAYHGRTMAASSISSSYRYTRQFGNVIDTYTIPFQTALYVHMICMTVLQTICTVLTVLCAYLRVNF